jgi:hypothetical protein
MRRRETRERASESYFNTLDFFFKKNETKKTLTHLFGVNHDSARRALVEIGTGRLAKQGGEALSFGLKLSALLPEVDRVVSPFRDLVCQLYWLRQHLLHTSIPHHLSGFFSLFSSKVLRVWFFVPSGSMGRAQCTPVVAKETKETI